MTFLIFLAVLLFESCLAGFFFLVVVWLVLCLFVFSYLFFWYVIHRTYFIVSSKIQIQGENQYYNVPFLFQGIATSLGIMADIFASMNEKDYVRFKTNAEIDLVRLGLVFVCVGSSDGLYVIVPNSPVLCSSRSSSLVLRGPKKVPLKKLIST